MLEKWKYAEVRLPVSDNPLSIQKRSTELARLYKTTYYGIIEEGVGTFQATMISP